MYQALYRKYRPRDFDDVCGQEHITSILKNEIETGHINHAYLFCGSRGTGKTTCAKILAKAVNCTGYKNGHVCGKCAACTGADSGSLTDIIEMDAASNNGVANIRDIRDEVSYLPSELKYRVYIVDEVHMLSSSAFNALLKTLEEPPAHVIFILATTELQKLPSTIISRCQRFDFRRIPSAVIADRLEYIAMKENIKLEREAAFSIAAIAQGGMRDAISLLELCANGAADGTVTDEIVADIAGAGDRDFAERTVTAVSEKDYETIFEITSKIHMSSKDMAVFWQSLCSFYRDMLVIKSTSAAKEYLDLSESRFQTASRIAGMFPPETLVHHIKILDDAYIAMQRGVTNKRLCAECALVRMCDEKLSPTYDALNARVAKLERLVRDAQLNVCAEANGGTVKGEDIVEEHPEVPPRDTGNKKAAAGDETAGSAGHTEVTVRKVALSEGNNGAAEETGSGERAKNLNSSADVTYARTDSEKSSADSARFRSQTSAGNIRRLKTVGYYPEVVNQFGLLYPMEGAFLEEADAYSDENGRIRVRVESEIALTMLSTPEVYAGLLKIFNSYENGRLDGSTLLIETVQAAKNSFIDEIIDSAGE